MKECISNSCNKKSVSLGYCDKHYRRFKKYGNSERVYIFIAQKCSVEKCDKRSRSKGLCELHYRRFIKTGSTDLVKEKRQCSVSECTRKHVAKNLCALHYEMKTQKITMDSKSIKMVDNHNGMCDICGSTVPGFGRKKLCIDHDHKTGKFRGMLCQKCNLGLGNFNDSPDLLKKATIYLKNSQNML